jgi:hypothetical protein
VAWSKLHLYFSNKLQELSRKGPSHLKFFALIAKLSAELEYIVFLDYGLCLNWRIHGSSTDLLWKAYLIFERANSYRSIVKKYNQCVRLVRYATNSKDRWALSQALIRIVHAISPFIRRLSWEKQNKIAEQYSASALQICRLAAWIAEQNESDDDLFYSVIAALTISKDQDCEAWKWAKETTERIKKLVARKKAEEILHSHEAKLSGEENERDRKSIGRQIYENMAAAIGIDLADPHDPEAQIVRLGLKDLDPTRALKDCKHLFITTGFSQPLIAQALRMPSAGEKIIHCTLHCYAAGGQSLDVIYGSFKQKFCNACPDCSPRPSNWEYSDEWQKQELERLDVYMQNFKNAISNIWGSGSNRSK